MHETTPVAARPPAAPRWSRLQRAVAGAGVALLVGGAVGVAVRLLMRAVAVVLSHEPSMSLVATAAIVLLFAVGLVPAAVLLALGVRRTGLGVLGVTTLLHLSQIIVVGLDEGGRGTPRRAVTRHRGDRRRLPARTPDGRRRRLASDLPRRRPLTIRARDARVTSGSMTHPARLRCLDRIDGAMSVGDRPGRGGAASIRARRRTATASRCASERDFARRQDLHADPVSTGPRLSRLTR